MVFALSLNFALKNGWKRALKCTALLCRHAVGSLLLLCVVSAWVSLGNISAVHALDVKIDGSSTVFPITEAIAEEFQNEYRGSHRVTVGVSGTGGGFKKFCRGDVAISNASRPIRKNEMESCAAAGIEFIELPVAFDAIAVVVNPRNNWVNSFSVDELKTMWEPQAQGKITNWNQIRPGFPDAPLNLFGPGVDSGTYDYFTAAIVGKEHSSRGDYTASEDDNTLVIGVSGDQNALGFFGLAYFSENQSRLKALSIIQPDGNQVLPSVYNVEKGIYQPLSRPIFIYVNKAMSDDNSAVDTFVKSYLDADTVPDLVLEVGYVPLPQSAYRLALSKFSRRVTGTAFDGGAQIGVTIESLVR